MSQEVTDVELVARIAAPGPGRTEAESVFCARYAARARRYAERHLRDDQAAADLAQLALLSVIEALRQGRVEDPQRLGAFVLSTCRYLVWDENRARLRERRLRQSLGVEPESYEAASLTSIDRMRLEGCMQGLPPREQRVVWLTYCEEWAPDRIAAELATSSGNVRVIRHRALAHLASCLDDRAPAVGES